MIDTEPTKSSLQRELDALVRVRDELRLQVSLAKADARKELDRLELGLRRLQEEAQRAQHSSQRAAHDIGDATRTLVEELKRGYERIKHDFEKA